MNHQTRIGTTIAFANHCRTTSALRIRHLQESGFNVEFCRDASKVLALFRRSDTERPRILVTGCSLPHGDELSESETEMGTQTGVAIYKYLRLNASPTIPVVICTIDKDLFARLMNVDDTFMVPVYEYDQFDPTIHVLNAVKKLRP